MRVAEAAHKAGAKVLYYIAPQLWAWRPERARRLAATVDRLAVVLPFEASTLAIRWWIAGRGPAGSKRGRSSALRQEPGFWVSSPAAGPRRFAGCGSHSGTRRDSCSGREAAIGSWSQVRRRECTPTPVR
jgi:hypothetical protein